MSVGGVYAEEYGCMRKLVRSESFEERRNEMVIEEESFKKEDCGCDDESPRLSGDFGRYKMKRMRRFSAAKASTRAGFSATTDFRRRRRSARQRTFVKDGAGERM